MQGYLVTNSPYGHSKNYSFNASKKRKISISSLPKTFKDLSYDSLDSTDCNYKGKCSKFWEIFDKPTQPISVKYQVLSGKTLKKTERLKKKFSLFRPKAKSTENKSYIVKKMTLPPIIAKPKSIFQHWEVQNDEENSFISFYTNILNYPVYKNVFSLTLLRLPSPFL